jgi:Putative prokaryotic signal transducing protein
MAMIDPEQERARLTEVYSQQTDEQLEEIARHGDDLTEVALQSLHAELSTRGLTNDPPEESADANQAELAFRDLITLRSYWNLLEAELAKGALEAAGIECFLFDDNMLRMDWFNANAIGGVKLRVDRRNVDDANRILEESIRDGESEMQG